MKVRLSTEVIKQIDLFQNLTNAHVIDCMRNEEMYFVIAEHQYGLAIGKNGSKIRNAEKVFKKPIRVFEYSKNLERFVKNMIPEAKNIIIRSNDVQVFIKNSDRARVIGRGGKKIKIINEFLKRLHGTEVKIK